MAVRSVLPLSSAIALLGLMLTLSMVPASEALTVDQYNDVVTVLKNAYAANSTATGGPIKLATVVRLAFHMCVGGCDGCVNLNHTPNTGLALIISLLESIYQANNYGAVLSRADFWALAAVVAVQVTAVPSPGLGPFSYGPYTDGPLPLTFQWGRVDCPTAPSTSALYNFPDGMGNLAEVKRIFVDGEFSMTVQQVTALLGAHTLGGMNKDNSGFKGPWAPDTKVFSNKFYKNFFLQPYSHQTNTLPSAVQNRTQQFNAIQVNTASQALTLLHTDMALLKEFPVSYGANGQITGVDPAGCVLTKQSAAFGSYDSVANCIESEAAPFTHLYAENQTAFYEDFSDAFIYMMSHTSGKGNSYILYDPISCVAGYVASGHECVDVNECATDNGGCDQVCTNSDGSYACSCNQPGYFLLLADSHSCVLGNALNAPGTPTPNGSVGNGNGKGNQAHAAASTTDLSSSSGGVSGGVIVGVVAGVMLVALLVAVALRRKTTVRPEHMMPETIAMGPVSGSNEEMELGMAAKFDDDGDEPAEAVNHTGAFDSINFTKEIPIGASWTSAQPAWAVGIVAESPAL